MAKKTSTAALDVMDEKPFIIKGATLKDGFCNCSYELGTGVTKGAELNFKGPLLVHEDMFKAFHKLRPHLAAICEELEGFKVKDIEAIDDYNPDDHKEGSLEHKLSHFYVTSFSIKGTGEKEGVSISGTKRLSTGEHLSLTTPAEKYSGKYKYINELRVAVDDIIEEVELYMEGKSQPKMVQGSLNLPDSSGGSASNFDEEE